METSWKIAPRPKAAESHAEEAFAPAQDGDDGIDEAERVKSGGDTKPEKLDSPMIGFNFSIRLCKNRVMAVATLVPIEEYLSTSWDPTASMWMAGWWSGIRENLITVICRL